MQNITLNLNKYLKQLDGAKMKIEDTSMTIAKYGQTTLRIIWDQLRTMFVGFPRFSSL